MRIKKSGILLLFLFVYIFCFVFLYVNSPANAQYSASNYYNFYNNYNYSTQALSPSYLYNTQYQNNYSWSTNQYSGSKINIPTLEINNWSIQPNFGNTVYSVSSDGGALTIYGTYFSAHTHAGVNFNRQLFMDSQLFSPANQAMYTNTGGQFSFNSPVDYYARQVLQFSPVLHGPLLNNF